MAGKGASTVEQPMALSTLLQRDDSTDGAAPPTSLAMAADTEHNPTSGPRRRTSSIPEAAQPRDAASRDHAAIMEHSRRQPSEGSVDVAYTRTGRVSKAKKGKRDAHVCECGKVSFVVHSVLE